MDANIANQLLKAARARNSYLRVIAVILAFIAVHFLVADALFFAGLNALDRATRYVPRPTYTPELERMLREQQEAQNDSP